MKTAELTGVTLAYAVAMAHPGFNFSMYRHLTWPDEAYWVMDSQGRIDHYEDDTGNGMNRHYDKQGWRPDENWDQAGPIIDREEIMFFSGRESPSSPTHVIAYLARSGTSGVQGSGPNHLIAAMRCYVASVLSDEVKLPPELTP